MLAVSAPAMAQAQLFRPRPAPPPPAEAPPPDPKAWWEDKEPNLEDRFDPLGERRPSKAEAAAPRAISNGVEPLLYRLWDLPPLQTQLVRGGEAVIELWVRPSGSVRQLVVRVTVRGDGRAFVQARAGLGCCRAQILRRVDIDQDLPPGAGEPFLALAQNAAWSQPEAVVAREKGAGVLEPVCVSGVAYDLTLMTRQAVRHLRRSCDSVEIGSVAALLGPTVAAALGRDPRFDYLLPKGADFAADAEAYRGFTASGGTLATPSLR